VRLAATHALRAACSASSSASRAARSSASLRDRPAQTKRSGSSTALSSARRTPRPPTITARGLRGSRRFELIQALRRHPHARSVYPFGDELHYTDAREGAPPSEVAADVAAYLAREGFADVEAEPARAGIEDSFMALMGAPEQAAA